MTQISNTCTCGVTTITQSPNKYGEVSWTIADVHTMREEIELPKWEDHEAEAFLEVNDSSISEVQTSTGWEWLMDLLQENEDIQEIKDGKKTRER